MMLVVVSAVPAVRLAGGGVELLRPRPGEAGDVRRERGRHQADRRHVLARIADHGGRVAVDRVARLELGGLLDLALHVLDDRQAVDGDRQERQAATGRPAPEGWAELGEADSTSPGDVAALADGSTGDAAGVGWAPDGPAIAAGSLPVGRGVGVGAGPQAATTSDTRSTATRPNRASGMTYSSRRATGKRSSSTAMRKPARTQKAGLAALVASGRAFASGYASTAAKPRAARSSQTAATSRSASPPWRASSVTATHVITAGSGALGRLRVQLAKPERPRIGGERPELAVGGGTRLAVRLDLQHLRIAAEDGQAPAQEPELPGPGHRHRRQGLPARRERVVGGRVVVEGERVGRGRSRGWRERIGGWPRGWGKRIG